MTKQILIYNAKKMTFFFQLILFKLVLNNNNNKLNYKNNCFNFFIIFKILLNFFAVRKF